MSQPHTRGIGILINKAISYTEIEMNDPSLTHSSIELQAISLKLQYESCLLVNVYRHPSINTPTHILNNLMAFCNSFPHCLVVGDVNAHHTGWFNEFEDYMGKTVNHLIESYGLIILNDGLPTLLPRSNHVHSNIVIDLVLASASLIPLCSSNTFDDCLGSDHFPIVTCLGGNFLPCQTFVYKYNLGISQLASFRDLCKKQPILTTLNLNPDGLISDSISGVDACNEFTDHVKNLIHSLIPEKARYPRTCRKDTMLHLGGMTSVRKQSKRGLTLIFKIPY